MNILSKYLNFTDKQVTHFLEHQAGLGSLSTEDKEEFDKLRRSFAKKGAVVGAVAGTLVGGGIGGSAGALAGSVAGPIGTVLGSAVGTDKGAILGGALGAVGGTVAGDIASVLYFAAERKIARNLEEYKVKYNQMKEEYSN